MGCGGLDSYCISLLFAVGWLPAVGKGVGPNVLASCHRGLLIVILSINWIEIYLG